MNSSVAIRTLVSHPIMNQIPVADPGFPVGGDANLQRVHFSAKTYAKTKEMDPVGGGRIK